MRKATKTPDFIPLASDDEGDIDDSSGAEEDVDYAAMGLPAEADRLLVNDSGEGESDDDDNNDAEDESGDELEENGEGVTEGKEGAGEDEEDTKQNRKDGWGKSAKNFYEKDLDDDEDEDGALGSGDEEDEEMQIAEAVQLQRDGLSRMSAADFGIEDVLDAAKKGKSALGTEKAVKSAFEQELDAIVGSLSVDEVAVEGVPLDNTSSPGTALKSSLSQSDRRRLIRRDHPELLQLLSELKERAQQLSTVVQPILAGVKTRQLVTDKGLSYLEAKNHLLLSYLQYLCFYVLLKLHGRPVANHPVISRLVELRLIMEKMQPLDKQLEPQIRRLLSIAVAGEAEASSGARVKSRPRPDLLVGPDDRDDESDHAGESVRAGDDDGETSTDAGESGDETELKQEKKSGIYKPPLVMAMEYSKDVESKLERELRQDEERGKRRARTSEVVAALREKYQTVPLELGGSQTKSAELERDRATRKLLKHQADKERYEEENMLRLPTTKAERKAARLLREKEKRYLAGGDTMDDLATFADSAIDAEDFDPTLGLLAGGGSKKAAKLASSLNAIKQAADTFQKSMEVKAADRHVASKAVKRQQADRDNRTDVFDGMDDNFGGDEDFPDESAVPDVVKNAFARKVAKKQAAEAKLKAFLMDKHMPKLNEEVEGKRGTNYQIEKNKGLTRKRKKIEGNSRVHNRAKFEKKLKRLKGAQQGMVEGSASGDYGGEATGIKSHVAKSIRLGGP